MSDQSYTRFLSKEQQDPDLRSDMVKARAAVPPGTLVNFCRTDGFGCEDKDLDEKGYCRHLVGFTAPGDPTKFFPLKDRPRSSPHADVFRWVDGKDVRDVLPTDRILENTVACWVYRDVDAVAEEEQEEQETPKRGPGRPKKNTEELVPA